MIKIGSSVATLLIVALLTIGFVVGAVVVKHHAKNITRIAPTYVLSSNYYEPCYGKFCSRTPHSGHFGDFWQEATKNTTFTIDGKPVQITDVQIFYKQDPKEVHWFECDSFDYFVDFWINHPNYKWWGSISQDNGKIFVGYVTDSDYTHDNITYYPSGIENSQTYNESSFMTLPNWTYGDEISFTTSIVNVSSGIVGNTTYHYTHKITSGETTWGIQLAPTPTSIPCLCSHCYYFPYISGNWTLNKEMEEMCHNLNKPCSCPTPTGCK